MIVLRFKFQDDTFSIAWKSEFGQDVGGSNINSGPVDGRLEV